MSDSVNPTHYKLANGHEVIEVSENLSSNGGQAVQYIARATRTDGVVKGDPIEDLQKAQWFISREMTRLAGPHATEDPEAVSVRAPRVWQSLTEVPEGVIVEDRHGDAWGSASTDIHDLWGPFTEALDG